MDEIELYKTNHPNYYLKLIRLSEPQTWTKLRVEIYNKDDEKIGEYNRNYDFLDTFWVFTQSQETYALYSRIYGSTRVFKLIDGKFVDWCGEDDTSNGFCPVEFYVPTICKFSDTEVPNAKGILRYIDGREKRCWSWNEDVPFGFVAGCYWGDDCSWKVQYLDLSQIQNKILTRKELFGYIALGDNLKLKDSVRVDDGEGSDDYIVSIAIQNTWQINNHKIVQQYDD